MLEQPCSRVQSDDNLMPVSRRRAYLVEDMVVALRVCELHNSGPLQEVRTHSSTADAACFVELDLHKLPKARGVVIPHRLGIAKCLQQWIGLEHLRLWPRVSLVQGVK